MPDPLAPTRTPAPRQEPAPTRVINGPVTDTPEPGRHVDQAPGYVVLHEIARGGMGRVVAARDPKLDREVAIKFLLPSPDPAAAARFVREAEITARLPHPGVPPVHALGRTPGGQPFLVMKLVRGRTLADLLDARPTPAHDLPRFVAIFEQVCQAVGYAHSQGVIHRDLKPANVMVGAFGEVQVMDWGLALDGGEAVGKDVRESPGTTVPGLRAEHPKAQSSGPLSSLTVAGTVLGTPGYMSPEQARGEAIDPRSDVFALGGILAAVLTGRQPLPDRVSAYSAAEDGIVAAADLRAWLGGAGADPELTRLALRCLSPDPADRPDGGRGVADAVAGYRANAEDRARRAEADRAAAEGRAAAEAATRLAVQARAAAEARARRAAAGLVVAVAVVLGLLGAIAWWRDRTDRDRELQAARAAEAQAAGEAERAAERAAAAADREAAAAERGRAAAERRSAVEAAVRNLELADDLRDRFRFHEAARAVALAGELAARVGAADLAPRVARSKADLDTVRALDAARTKQMVWVPQKDGLGRFADASADFQAAFAAAGFDPVADDLEAAAARVAASPIKAHLVAGLDDWVPNEYDRAVQARLLELARLADPGEWTDRLRDAAVRSDDARVVALASSADPEKLTPTAVVALARLMLTYKLDPAPLLFRAHAAHPGDYRIAFHLGEAFNARDPGRAVGYYRAARALRPDSFAVNINLGVVLLKIGDAAGARLAYQNAARIDPTSPMAAYNLARALEATGDPLGAVASMRRAVALLPSYANAHLELVRLLEQAGDRPAALEAARAAAAAVPDDRRTTDALAQLLQRGGGPDGALDALRVRAAAAPADHALQTQLGGALVDAGRLDEGIAALRRAVALAPAEPTAYRFLGLAHVRKGDHAAVVGWFRKAAELDPTDARAQANLGGALVNVGRVDDGLAALDAAVRLDPRLAFAHQFRGVALNRKGNPAAAAAAYRAAAELDPALPRVHYDLGTSLANAGDFAAAVPVLREAVRRNPADVEALTNLGDAYAGSSRPADAADAYRAALRRRPAFAPAAAGLARVERPLAP